MLTVSDRFDLPPRQLDHDAIAWKTVTLSNSLSQLGTTICFSCYHWNCSRKTRCQSKRRRLDAVGPNDCVKLRPGTGAFVTKHRYRGCAVGQAHSWRSQYIGAARSGATARPVCGVVQQLTARSHDTAVLLTSSFLPQAHFHARPRFRPS